MSDHLAREQLKTLRDLQRTTDAILRCLNGIARAVGASEVAPTAERPKGVDQDVCPACGHAPDLHRAPGIRQHCVGGPTGICPCANFYA